MHRRRVGVARRLRRRTRALASAAGAYVAAGARYAARTAAIV